MCMTLYTVVFHSNSQYIMLPAHCEVKTVDQGKFMQTEAVNCRLRVKCRQHGAKYRMRTADLG